ncbi:uncharacterized protein LOC118187457 [Stegodyphus dumicola]|uniref:uncharacterized protein LOC118187457 n=1 Tax=Stegodyphus dumicola TaxID=202533 RepID=UPI0015AE3DF9|nr:uncharacterized protein LOC118187457 [Stegodyphus dumicola]
MDSVIIAGGGPVGSFMAVLCSLLDLRVTVYEKREQFTRNINLKIESGFFNEVQKAVFRLGIENEFFAKLNKQLQNQGYKILIKDLETRCAEEAKSLGAEYIRYEVNSFQELYEKHRTSNPIILDCTGRNSKLRINAFGLDEHNIVSTPLQHAMYINFKAKMANGISLYQAMKYISSVKLTEVVVSKNQGNSGLTDVTLPVFINEELARDFDRDYPNIKREPLNPFNCARPVPDSIFFPIASLLGNLILDGCIIDLNSVRVKKIEISCGYAKKRSNNNFICLGDSAIHLAFFKSLNLGLKHALELFIKLSMLPKENKNCSFKCDDVKRVDILKQFKENNPHLNPEKVYPTAARNVFLVVTRVIWYGCFSYCSTNQKTERLTNQLGIKENRINGILQELNHNLTKWDYLLADFEAKRDEDIQYEVTSNKTKSMLFDYASLVIDINGKSFIKISELARMATGKFPLLQRDFKFLFRYFQARREAITVNNGSFITAISYLLDQFQGCSQLKELCAAEISNEQKRLKINDMIRKKFATMKIIWESKQDEDNADLNSYFISILIRNEFVQTLNLTDSSNETNSTLDDFVGSSHKDPFKVISLCAKDTLEKGTSKIKKEVLSNVPFQTDISNESSSILDDLVGPFDLMSFGALAVKDTVIKSTSKVTKEILTKVPMPTHNQTDFYKGSCLNEDNFSGSTNQDPFSLITAGALGVTNTVIKGTSNLVTTGASGVANAFMQSSSKITKETVTKAPQRDNSNQCVSNMGYSAESPRSDPFNVIAEGASGVKNTIGKSASKLQKGILTKVPIPGMNKKFNIF